MPTKTQRAAAMASRSDAGSSTLQTRAAFQFLCDPSGEPIADFRLIQTQTRFYSVPYNDKIAKFNGSKGSDVRQYGKHVARRCSSSRPMARGSVAA